MTKHQILPVSPCATQHGTLTRSSPSVSHTAETDKSCLSLPCPRGNRTCVKYRGSQQQHSVRSKSAFHFVHPIFLIQKFMLLAETTLRSSCNWSLQCGHRISFSHSSFEHNNKYQNDMSFRKKKPLVLFKTLQKKCSYFWCLVWVRNSPLEMSGLLP